MKSSERRDFFAGLAMCAIMQTDAEQYSCATVAERAYQMADAMIAHPDKNRAAGNPNAIDMVEIPGDPFLIGKYPVTNAQYKAFLDATDCASGGWKYPLSKANHPAVSISFYQAEACARWYGMRLPTEQEWEKAARGTDGREYPWGNEFDPQKCNTKEGGPGGTTPVDRYPEGASPYGVMNMAGNVWDWTSSLWEGEGNSRVLRGGSWYYFPYFARCSSRYWSSPDLRSNVVGFRCARTL